MQDKIFKTGLETVRTGWLDLAILSGWLTADLLAGVAAYQAAVQAERILACQPGARLGGVRWD